MHRQQDQRDNLNVFSARNSRRDSQLIEVHHLEPVNGKV